jgi:glyoxylase-like metal-dependent hydrolase (beta-lactamase superfamily II)
VIASGPSSTPAASSWVELNHVISPEIRLTPSIRHTPGHLRVMIESKGKRAVITSDIVHYPCQMAHLHWSFGLFDRKTTELAHSRLFAEWADETIVFIGSHFAAPTAGQIVRDGAA